MKKKMNKDRRQWIAVLSTAVILCAALICITAIPSFADRSIVADSTIDTSEIGVRRPSQRRTVADQLTAVTTIRKTIPTEAEVQTLIQTYLDYKTLYDSSLEKLLLELKVCTEQELNIYHEQPHNFPLVSSYRAYANSLWQVVNLDSMEGTFLAENESDGEKGCLTPVREEQPEVWRQASAPVFLSENDDIRLYRVLVNTEDGAEQWYQCRLIPIYGMYRIDSFIAVEE